MPRQPRRQAARWTCKGWSMEQFAWPFGPERFTAVLGCAAQELLRLIGTLVYFPRGPAMFYGLDLEW